MTEKLRIDAYVCNDCGFKFLGSTRFKSDINRMVLCPKCSGLTKIDKYATVKNVIWFLVFCTVATILCLGIMKYFALI